MGHDRSVVAVRLNHTALGPEHQHDRRLRSSGSLRSYLVRARRLADGAAPAYDALMPARATNTELLFATRIYRAPLGGRGNRRRLADLDAACRLIAREDRAGQAWAKAHGYAGYTSYASLDDLVWRSPEFQDLVARLDAHVAAFADEVDLDLGRRKLVIDSIWINVLRRGGTHSGHIHPNCVVSGTFYVAVPDGSGAIRFEDPRLTQMMAAPPRRKRARREHRAFHEITPAAGTVLLWESWLRHEVLANRGQGQRISISFNYRWE